jgi:hypothetical protein
MMTPKRLSGELTARLDGPHRDEHTSAAADLAAEAVRYLNYATGSHCEAGLEFPSTVYVVAADLGLAIGRMPQLFTQLADWLHGQLAAGMLATDDGSPPAEAIASAFGHLSRAADDAARLAADLTAAQCALAAVNGRGPNRAGCAL